MGLELEYLPVNKKHIGIWYKVLLTRILKLGAYIPATWDLKFIPYF